MCAAITASTSKIGRGNSPCAPPLERGRECQALLGQKRQSKSNRAPTDPDPDPDPDIDAHDSMPRGPLCGPSAPADQCTAAARWMRLRVGSVVQRTPWAWDAHGGWSAKRTLRCGWSVDWSVDLQVNTATERDALMLRVPSRPGGRLSGPARPAPARLREAVDEAACWFGRATEAVGLGRTWGLVRKADPTVLQPAAGHRRRVESQP
jgi:hypothetical protein